MAGTNPNTILVSVNGGSTAERPLIERAANVALTPGELAAFSADNELDPHGTANGAAQKMFIVEDPYREPGANAAIDTDYAVGDLAYAINAQPGDIVYGWLAASEVANEGDALMSDGAGALQVTTVDATVVVGAIVGYAGEDLTAGGSRARIKVKVA